MGLKDFFARSSEEVSTNNSGTSASTKNNSNGGTWIPRTDEDVEWIALKVCERWENEPEYIIKGKTPEKFREIVTIYKGFRRQIISSETGTMSKTERKSALVSEMRTGFKILYSYVQEYIFPETNTDPYMRDFGFVKTGTGYSFPSTEIERIGSLEKLIESVKSYGFSDKALGLEYWQNIYNEYVALVENRDNTTGEKRVIIAQKNKYKLEIQRYLRALKHLLSAVHDESDKANAASLADWGFKYIY